MTHHPAEATLHALVDGELEPDLAARTESHVASCDRCAAIVHGAERVKRAAAAAPREMAPPPSVLLGLQTAIGAGRAGERPAMAGTPSMSAPPPHDRRRTSRWLAAAGIATFALASFGVGREWSRARQPEGDAGPVATMSGALALGELLRELEVRRPLLAPQTIEVMEEQLGLIDAAIGETERALASDPRNVHLDRMLQQAKRQREEYLRTTLSLAATL